MPKNYTKEQFWKLYKKLPQELKDAVFAEDTGETLYDICKRNDVLEKLDFLIEEVGRVLLGVLPPEDFKKGLEKEIKKEEAAKQTFHEINRFIFAPVKYGLEELYGAKITPAGPTEEKLEEKPPSSDEDAYREPVE